MFLFITFLSIRRNQEPDPDGHLEKVNFEIPSSGTGRSLSVRVAVIVNVSINVSRKW